VNIYFDHIWFFISVGQIVVFVYITAGIIEYFWMSFQQYESINTLCPGT